MMIIIKQLKYIQNYIYQNILLPKILNIKYKDILLKNFELKNIKRGKRCFIIGGGPSINEIDLSLLKNEETFCMNELDQHPMYKEIQPKYHSLIDTAYFTQPLDYFHTQQFLKKTNTISPSTSVFVNIKAKEFIKKHEMFTGHCLYYISMQGIMNDKFDFNIDIEKTIPFPKNSALLCLLLAVYMGYSKIYLLGCEHNFLSVHIAADKSLSYGWAYKDARDDLDTSNPEIVKKYLDERHTHASYEVQISRVKQLFKNYRLLYKKIKKLHPDINIYNATPQSFLDVFPAINFKDIKFPSKKYA